MASCGRPLLTKLLVHVNTLSYRDHLVLLHFPSLEKRERKEGKECKEVVGGEEKWGGKGRGMKEKQDKIGEGKERREK